MPRSHIPKEENNVHHFANSSVTLAKRYAKALSLTSAPINPIRDQGHRSYTIYASPAQDQIVQFRPARHFISLDAHALAKRVYGDLVPEVSFEGEMGDDDEEKGLEAECVYVMRRVPGVTRNEFLKETLSSLKDLNMEDQGSRLLEVNKTFAVDLGHEEQRNKLKEKCLRHLQAIRTLLPCRFTSIVDGCVTSLDAVYSLPMTLQHMDPSDTNVFVDSSSGKITGVIGWSGAEVLPFGMAFYSAEALTRHSKAETTDGSWVDHNVLKLSDYARERKVFWDAIKEEVGELGEETMRTIQQAGVLGALMKKRLSDEGKEDEEEHESWLDEVLVNNWAQIE